jgi:hypothetical protein
VPTLRTTTPSPSTQIRSRRRAAARRHATRRDATPEGTLSPLQAQLDLALPPNRGLPDIKIRIDIAGLRNAGCDIPEVTRVSSTVTGAGGRVYTMPGGGYEMQFPYAVPGDFLKVES